MKLSTEAIEQRLPQLPEWKLAGGKLHREYKFPDFGRAMNFFATSTPAIEKMDHHPEWSNVYDRVTVDLISHDAGGITELDFRLAGMLEEIAQKLI